MNISRRHILNILPWLLISLAFLRMISFASHHPMIGYANQYDMARTSACIGLWPIQKSPYEAKADSPIRNYISGAVMSDVCYPSTDVFLADISKSLWSLAVSVNMANPAEFDLRWVGATKIIVLLVAAMMIAFALRDRPGIGTIHSLALLLVFADPINTLFFNTLYTEFGAFIGSYLMLGAFLALGVKQIGSQAYLSIILIMSGMLALLFSRTQHVWLPLVLFIIYGFFFLRFEVSRRNGILAVLSVLVTIGYASRLSVNDQLSPGLGKANIVNTVFLTHLPVYPDTSLALRNLGLGPDCETLVFTSWFRNRGYNFDEICPEVFTMPRSRLITALLQQPAALTRMAAFAAYSSTGWRMGSVGEVEGVSYARSENQGFIYASMASWLVESSSFGQYVFFWALPIISGLIAGLVLMVCPIRSLGSNRDYVLTCLMSLVVGMHIITYAWASSLFGDGSSELAKHLHLAQLFALVSWLVIAALGVYLTTETVRRRQVSTEDTGSGPLAVVWLFALSVPFALIASVAISRTAAAIGSIDMLDRHLVHSGHALEFSGWVKDPYGVEKVTVSFRGRDFPVHSEQPAYDVDRWFPIDSRFPAMSFRTLVDVGLPNADRMPLRLIVTNRRGHHRVVDTIWLQID